MSAETDALVHSNSAAVAVFDIETDRTDPSFAQRHRHCGRNDLRQALAPTIGPCENIADPGHALVAGHHVHAGDCDQFAASPDSAKESGSELKGCKGDTAAVAASVQPLHLLAVVGRERFRDSRGGRKIAQKHALHLAPLAIAIESGRDLELMRPQVQIAGTLRERCQQLSGRPRIAQHENWPDRECPEHQRQAVAQPPPVAVLEHPIVEVGQSVQGPLPVEVEPSADLGLVGELYTSIMRKIPLILAFMMSVSVAFAQVDSNSITVTASRNAIPASQPDQAIFSLHVISGLDTTLDDVLAALPGSGITIAYFQGLNSSYLTSSPGTQTPTIDWLFQFAVPLTKTKDTVTLLTGLQQAMAKTKSGLSMTFYIQGTQTSVPPQQGCSLSDLLTDARSQAQKLADGAGLGVGNILAISSPAGSAALGFAQTPTLGSATTPPGAPSSCSLTVKFSLLRV